MDKSKTIVDVKLRLVEKYEGMARVCKSKPKRHSLLTQATKYRRQAAQLERQPPK